MVIIGSQNGLCVQYLSLVTNENGPQARIRPGLCRPLHRAGLGIMLLTQKPDNEVARIVRRYNAEAEEGEVIVPESEVLSLVREARVKGYCQTANLAGRGAADIVRRVTEIGDAWAPTTAIVTPAWFRFHLSAAWARRPRSVHPTSSPM